MRKSRNEAKPTNNIVKPESNEMETESDSDSERLSIEEDEEQRVDVGFLQDALAGLSDHEKRLSRIVLKSPFFPSKVGGKPAWLDCNNVPLAVGNVFTPIANANDKDKNNNSDTSVKQQQLELKCSNCGSQLSFLLQIYAPNSFTYRHEHLVENHEDSFHRALFVFACISSSCRPNSSRTVKVLRSQLARQNEVFAYEPPPDARSIFGEDEQALEQELVACSQHLVEFRKRLRQRKTQLNDLCAVCGLSCTKKCSKCMQCFYCSQAHQLLHWTKLGHKELCGKYIESANDLDKLIINLLDDELDIDVSELNETISKGAYNGTKALLPEYEIVIEPEITSRALLRNGSDDQHHKFDYDEKSNRESFLV
jgi:hypothetical protein